MVDAILILDSDHLHGTCLKEYFESIQIVLSLIAWPPPLQEFSLDNTSGSSPKVNVRGIVMLWAYAPSISIKSGLKERSGKWSSVGFPIAVGLLRLLYSFSLSLMLSTSTYSTMESSVSSWRRLETGLWSLGEIWMSLTNERWHIW